MLLMLLAPYLKAALINSKIITETWIGSLHRLWVNFHSFPRCLIYFITSSIRILMLSCPLPKKKKKKDTQSTGPFVVFISLTVGEEESH